MQDDMQLKYACEAGIEKSVAEIFRTSKILQDIEIIIYSIVIKDNGDIVDTNNLNRVNIKLKEGTNIIKSESYFENSNKSKYKLIVEIIINITQQEGNIMKCDIKLPIYTKEKIN